MALSPWIGQYEIRDSKRAFKIRSSFIRDLHTKQVWKSTFCRCCRALLLLSISPGSSDVTGRVAETQIEPQITALGSNLTDLRNAEVNAYSSCSKFCMAVKMENQIRFVSPLTEGLRTQSSEKRSCIEWATVNFIVRNSNKTNLNLVSLESHVLTWKFAKLPGKTGSLVLDVWVYFKNCSKFEKILFKTPY